MDLAYHSDYSEIAGTWGFVNEDGVEVVPPQYIYAEDFYGGIAIVCKGKWTIDKKWDNKYNSGRYWTEEEMWGAIDKEGNEVIPFIFDEIKHFGDVDDVFMAHYGGWKDGHWGVIDNQGNWLAEPIFEDIDMIVKRSLERKVVIWPVKSLSESNRCTNHLDALVWVDSIFIRVAVIAIAVTIAISITIATITITTIAVSTIIATIVERIAIELRVNITLA